MNWKFTAQLIFVVVGMSLLIWGVIYSLKIGEKLQQNHRYTKGVVIERQYRKREEAIRCKYVINNKEYLTHPSVGAFEYRNNFYFNIGDSLVVKYYPPDPEICSVDLDSSLILLKQSRR